MDLEKQCAHVASIMGPGSAATSALRELRKRREAGERVVLILDESAWVVGPHSEQPHD